MIIDRAVYAQVSPTLKDPSLIGLLSCSSKTKQFKCYIKDDLISWKNKLGNANFCEGLRTMLVRLAVFELSFDTFQYFY